VVLLTRRSFSLSDFFCCLRSLPSSSAQCCPAPRVFNCVAIFLGPVLCPLVDCLGTKFLSLKPIWLPRSLSSVRRPELSFSSHRGLRPGRHPGSVFHRFFPSAVGPSSPLVRAPRSRAVLSAAGLLDSSSSRIGCFSRRAHLWPLPGARPPILVVLLSIRSTPFVPSFRA
jgi:hypothetical protein